MKISTVLIFTSLWIFLVNLALLNNAHAESQNRSFDFKVEIIKQKDRTVPLEANLGATDFSFTEMKKKVTFTTKGKSEVSYLTDTRAAYRVKNLTDIENFAIVQWITGCQFESVLENNVITKDLSISRDHFGKIVPFKHIGWEIDSDSEDPVYSSFGEFGRYALLRWNKDPENLDPETAIYYADKKPEVLRVFATDMPGSAFVTSYATKSGNKLVAKNTSLEFKTCLFKMSDLPLKTDKKGMNIPKEKALTCFKWDHKFVYNYKTKKFATTGSIDPICKTTAAANF